MKKILVCLIIGVLFLTSGCSFCGILGGEPTTKSAAQIEEENMQTAKNAAIALLRNNLKNPQSLQVNNIQCKNTPPTGEIAESDVVDMDCKYIFMIDYSAQNGFGGTNRSNAIVKYYHDGNVYIAFDSDNSYSRFYNTYLLYSYVDIV